MFAKYKPFLIGLALIFGPVIALFGIVYFPYIAAGVGALVVLTATVALLMTFHAF